MAFVDHFLKGMTITSTAITLAVTAAPWPYSRPKDHLSN